MPTFWLPDHVYIEPWSYSAWNSKTMWPSLDYSSKSISFTNPNEAFLQISIIHQLLILNFLFKFPNSSASTNLHMRQPYFGSIVAWAVQAFFEILHVLVPVISSFTFFFLKSIHAVLINSQPSPTSSACSEKTCKMMLAKSNHRQYNSCRHYKK